MPPSHRSPAQVAEADERPSPPPAFSEAAAAILAAQVRPGVIVRETQAPRRIAPYAVAVSGQLSEDLLAEGGSADGGGIEASGRFILLHDPEAPVGWAGEQRVVVMLAATVEPDLAGDPLLADIAWSWLRDELEESGALWAELGGTVTTLSSQSFGCLDERPPSDRVELRASWSPRGPLDDHVHGWVGALCRMAGVPPVTPGVLTLPRRA